MSNQSKSNNKLKASSPSVVEVDSLSNGAHITALAVSILLHSVANLNQAFNISFSVSNLLIHLTTGIAFALDIHCFME